MTVVSLPFLLIFVAATLALRSRLGRDHRLPALAVASLAFAAASTESIGDGVCLAAMAATGWLVVLTVRRIKSPALLAVGLLCIVVEFVAIRELLPHGPMSSWLVMGPVLGSTIGLSYIMFRILHLIVDAHGDELPRDIGPLAYLTYLFCYLTFLAGPIQRYPEFARGLQKAPDGSHIDALREWAPRIIGGYFKLAALAGACFEAFTWLQSPSVDLPAFLTLALSLLCYALYLYISFSGYTDIVCGFGGLIGLELPANFDRPYLAADFLDFWSRWHISLSEWFKLYLFNPLVKALIGVNGRPALVPYLGAIGFFVTFLTMGLWHGVSPRFALYGVALGLGVSLNKLYQALMTQRLGRKGYNALVQGPFYASAARALAVTYFVLALGFIWVPSFSEAGTLGDWVEAAGVLLAAIFVLCVLAARTQQALPAFSHPLVAVLQLVLIATCLFVLHLSAPPLAYQFF